jgi:hypothetical protein
MFLFCAYLPDAGLGAMDVTICHASLSREKHYQINSSTINQRVSQLLEK